MRVGLLRGQDAVAVAFWLWLRSLRVVWWLGVTWHRIALALSACVLSARHPVVCALQVRRTLHAV